MSEEWGPWIEHDGQGCPCVGMYFQGEFDKRSFMELASSTRLSPCGMKVEGVAAGGNSWLHDGITNSKITRYRIRKPRGLTMLERVARDVTAPIEQVDA